MATFKEESLARWAALEKFEEQFGRTPLIARAQSRQDFDAQVKKSLETNTIQPGLMLQPLDESVRVS